MSDVRLRGTTPADLAYVLSTEADPDNAQWIIPWNEAQHAASLSDPDVRHLIVESAGAGAPVGYVILAGLHNPHRSIECRRLAVSAKGRGHGRAALRAVVALAFDELGAHRLWLDTQTRNTRARHLYASEGFVEEGVLRECWRQHGAWQSLVVMSILEPEYRAAGG